MLSYSRMSTVSPVSRTPREDESEMDEIQNTSRRGFTTDEEEEVNKSKLFARLSGNRVTEEVDMPEIQELIKGEKYPPSRRTLGYADPSLAEGGAGYDTNAVVRTTSVAKTRAKIAVAAYIAVILALAIAIAFTALSVSGTFSQAAALSGQIAGQETAITALETELSMIDEAALTAAAIRLGFTLPNTSNTVTYEAPVMRPPQTFEVTTNWFDRLCDGLCKLFGGN